MVHFLATFDFQPQGRFLFIALPAMSGLVALSLKRKAIGYTVAISYVCVSLMSMIYYFNVIMV